MTTMVRGQDSKHRMLCRVACKISWPVVEACLAILVLQQSPAEKTTGCATALIIVIDNSRQNTNGKLLSAWTLIWQKKSAYVIKIRLTCPAIA
ncbi:hypothetical protein [Undibacterium sp. KW1]|uniref:hypothetical protein n=1 Tax=Undibacterium sp. KW1 TaxID=2058624 RepID=UPI001389A9A3|nr:hypothetical protein [Undibacterium sp. KW1]